MNFTEASSNFLEDFGKCPETSGKFPKGFGNLTGDRSYSFQDLWWRPKEEGGRERERDGPTHDVARGSGKFAQQRFELAARASPYLPLEAASAQCTSG